MISNASPIFLNCRGYFANFLKFTDDRDNFCNLYGTILTNLQFLIA